MSHIRDAELAVERAIQCGTNGAFCFSVSDTDHTPIRSVKDAKEYLAKLLLDQQIKELKAKVAAIEAAESAKATEAAKAEKATAALKVIAEKVAHSGMEA
jgi:rRNA maturation endonuclease Nob1